MIGRAMMAAAFLVASASVAAIAQQQRSKSHDYGTKKICKVENKNGSRLGGKRTCRTQAEWDQIARESRLTAERIQASTSACLMGPNQPGKAGPVCSN